MALLFALVLASIQFATATASGCDDAAFERWAASHARRYATPAERSLRAATFVANCRDFQLLSADPDRPHVVHTQYTLLILLLSSFLGAHTALSTCF